MTNFTFWQRWLSAVAVIITVFGLLLAFFNQTLVFDLLFNQQINPVFWGSEEVGGEARAFQAWAYGVMGATMAGWGVFLTYIAQVPFKNRERWARNCLVIGLLVWYAVDTAISLSSRVYFNAAFNTLLLAGLIPPLAMTWKEFEQG
jgi:hypothetical protein